MENIYIAVIVILIIGLIVTLIVLACPKTREFFTGGMYKNKNDYIRRRLSTPERDYMKSKYGPVSFFINFSALLNKFMDSKMLRRSSRRQ